MTALPARHMEVAARLVTGAHHQALRGAVGAAVETRHEGIAGNRGIGQVDEPAQGRHSPAEGVGNDGSIAFIPGALG